MEGFIYYVHIPERNIQEILFMFIQAIKLSVEIVYYAFKDDKLSQFFAVNLLIIDSWMFLMFVIIYL